MLLLSHVCIHSPDIKPNFYQAERASGKGPAVPVAVAQQGLRTGRSSPGFSKCSKPILYLFSSLLLPIFPVTVGIKGECEWSSQRGREALSGCIFMVFLIFQSISNECLALVLALHNPGSTSWPHTALAGPGTVVDTLCLSMAAALLAMCADNTALVGSCSPELLPSTFCGPSAPAAPAGSHHACTHRDRTVMPATLGFCALRGERCSDVLAGRPRASTFVTIIRPIYKWKPWEWRTHKHVFCSRVSHLLAQYQASPLTVSLCLPHLKEGSLAGFLLGVCSLSGSFQSSLLWVQTLMPPWPPTHSQSHGRAVSPAYTSLPLQAWVPATSQTEPVVTLPVGAEAQFLPPATGKWI